MHTGQPTQHVVLHFLGGGATGGSGPSNEQADNDLDNFLDNLHSHPPYSDMLEGPEYASGPSRCHLPGPGDWEVDSDWYEWAFGTPHSSDSDYDDEVVQVPADQYVSVQQVRNDGWDEFLRWKASRLRRATQRSSHMADAVPSNSGGPAAPTGAPRAVMDHSVLGSALPATRRTRSWLMRPLAYYPQQRG